MSRQAYAKAYRGWSKITGQSIKEARSDPEFRAGYFRLRDAKKAGPERWRDYIEIAEEEFGWVWNEEEHEFDY